MSIYWDPTEIKPNAKRELAFAFGGGVASSLENEGRVKLDLAGSFEPGKLFTINAFVSDPAQGQNLTLELPAGMELVSGKETQPVPAVDGEGNCLVQWQARVLRHGKFALARPFQPGRDLYQDRHHLTHRRKVVYSSRASTRRKQVYLLALRARKKGMNQPIPKSRMVKIGR